MENNYIEIRTRLGEDTDKMCIFLNSKRIGYTICEVHHLAGFWLFPDNPHYTNEFRILGYSQPKMTWIMEILKEECAHITFHCCPINLVEKND